MIAELLQSRLRFARLAFLACFLISLAGCDLIGPEQPPSSVDLEIVEASSTFVTLQWSAAAVAVPDVRYEVERNGAVVQTTEGVEYTDENLESEKVYVYRVRPVGLAGWYGAWSEPVSATTLHCSEPPPGYAAYFPLEEGRTWRFTYTRTTTGFAQYGKWTRKWTGEIVWALESVECVSRGAIFVLTEIFDGYFTEDHDVGGETFRINEGPHSWETTLQSQIRGNHLEIPGYVHLPPGSSVNPVQDRRLELEWAYEESEPEEITSGETLWVGFHTWIRSGATLVRDFGFRTWWYTYEAGAPAPFSDSRRLTLIE